MRRIRMIVVALGAAGFLAGCEYMDDLPILGRIVAKTACDALFVAGHDTDQVATLVTGYAPPLRKSWQVAFDFDHETVEVRNRWFPWISPQSAAFVATDIHQGCRLQLDGVSPGPAVPLQAGAYEHLFDEDLQRFGPLQDFVASTTQASAPAYTTAVLVIHGNTVVAEAYSAGINRDSPLKGFSMSKSFANLLVGRQVDRATLQVHQPLPIREWQTDARAAITWDHSLRMSSGLVWNEAAIGKDNDQTRMLYESIDPSGYALAKPLAVAPGTQFDYSSGDYMNIATALVDQYPDWFDPGWNLGGRFAVEFTPDGLYPLLAEGIALTTRGWAQLMSLYANEGRLGSQQILSPQWVRDSLTPSATNGDYGAGVWLNQGQSLFPQLPADAFAFIGAYDRYVVAIPSRDLIVVRMGYSEQPGDFDMQAFVGLVLTYLPPEH